MAHSWNVGSRTLDLEYTRPNGGAARLSDLWAEGPAMLVWLRHCGCVFFQEALTELREEAPRFAERGVQLACIVQARPEEVRSVCGAELHCIPDPRFATHTALGLGRMSVWGLITSLAFHRRRAAASRAGFRQNWRRTFARESDTRRLPGAVLVARGGRILWLHRGEHAGDLPPSGDLLAVASEFATGPRF